MTTIRVKKDARYFTASNEPFNDKKLSWEARGLMGYLLSKPNDWQVNQTDIEKQGTAGREKVRRMLAELRKYGYMNRIRITVEHNKFDWITEVYESPSQNPSINSGFIKSQYTAFQSLAKPLTGKAIDIVSTDVLSTDSNDRFKQIVLKVSELRGGAINAMDAELIEYWLPKHTDFWIEEALKRTKAKGARSAQYADTILQGWEANGYPKTREERVQERKAKQPPSAYQQIKNILAEQKAERELSNVNV